MICNSTVQFCLTGNVCTVPYGPISCRSSLQKLPFSTCRNFRHVMTDWLVAATVGHVQPDAVAVGTCNSLTGCLVLTEFSGLPCSSPSPAYARAHYCLVGNNDRRWCVGSSFFHHKQPNGNTLFSSSTCQKPSAPEPITPPIPSGRTCQG